MSSWTRLPFSFWPDESNLWNSWRAFRLAILGSLTMENAAACAQNTDYPVINSMRHIRRTLSYPSYSTPRVINRSVWKLLSKVTCVAVKALFFPFLFNWGFLRLHLCPRVLLSLKFLGTWSVWPWWWSQMQTWLQWKIPETLVRSDIDKVSWACDEQKALALLLVLCEAAFYLALSKL